VQETGQEEEEHASKLLHKAEHRFLIAWLQCQATAEDTAYLTQCHNSHNGLVGA